VLSISQFKEDQNMGGHKRELQAFVCTNSETVGDRLNVGPHLRPRIIKDYVIIFCQQITPKNIIDQNAL
jgi:hypothetical protein